MSQGSWLERVADLQATSVAGRTLEGDLAQDLHCSRVHDALERNEVELRSSWASLSNSNTTSETARPFKYGRCWHTPGTGGCCLLLTDC